MMEERRSAQRLRTNINVRWESLKTEGGGQVCDLSAGGCFVLSGGEVDQGELLQIRLILDDQIVSLWGQVIYSVREMGFAVRFILTYEDGRHLRALLDELSAGEVSV
jgi:hypothetical protein